MTFKILNLTVKNLMSVGNITQAINFDRKDLTLVLGENLDLGGDDSGARNGCGKTTILNALSYAFFGQALTNIKKDNLINRANLKGLLVTVDFESNGVSYKIERGRKPGVLSFYKGNVAFAAKDNDAQGDSRETQLEIEKILAMSPDMFKHIVALNTYTEPFLSLRANDQRAIIEQLLGITLLSEKSEVLKEQIKKSKDIITAEDYRIKALQEANKKIEEQISAVKRRRDMWNSKHENDINSLVTTIEQLQSVNIEEEIKLHSELAEYQANEKTLRDLTALFNRASADKDREVKAVDKLIKELRELQSHTCHTCGQPFHGEKHLEIAKAKTQQLAEHNANKEAFAATMAEYDAAIKEIQALLKVKPITVYKTINEAYSHKSTLEATCHQLESKMAETNPYNEQIIEMESTALSEISYDIINAATKTRDHQEFLLKLLTSKDSFIRKRIIDQNLSYLNARLSYYLDKIGLPHTVVFLNDLSVEITEFGRDLDFDNLSRGERTRVILSLNFAFRDVWESLYEKINLLVVDELLDNGLDASGVEAAFGILKKMARDNEKSVWLISHRDELTARATNIFKVSKTGGFTTYLQE